jgi:GINS complex subunit 4
MTGVMDPKTNFSLIVIQTELERYKFVLRSFLRARLAKIAKFALHYLSPTHRHLLSPQEITFAENHQRLRHDHYLSSFLQSFPPQLRGLEDNAGGLEMVERPDEETAVWVRMRRDAVVEGRGRDGDDVYEAVRGEVLVVRWSDVREGVGAGVMELV